MAQSIFIWHIRMMKKVRVLHLGDEMGWRGGENQIQLLIEHTASKVDHFIAYPGKSRGYQKFQGYKQILGYFGRKLNPVSLYQLVSFCKRHKVHIIDAHSSVGHSMGILAKYFLPHIKLVVHRRVAFPISDRARTKKKYFHKFVDQYVAVSHKIAESLTDYGVAADKVQVVHSGVKIFETKASEKKQQKDKLLEQIGVRKDVCLIGNASAFTSEKDYPTLLKALKLLHDKKVVFHGVFAGDGKDLEDCKNLAKRLGLEGHVTFLGYQNNCLLYTSDAADE